MIAPLIQPVLRASLLYTRARGPTEATEFSMTRFLVPYLSGYEGISLFMDSDMLCLADIFDLLEAGLADLRAVAVCQHDYTPKGSVKMDGQQQTTYPRKNWSSLIVFNNDRCQALTPDCVNTATGLDLHRFNWLTDLAPVGSIPLEWNWLVGEYAANPAAKVLHYTLGGPWFRDYENCDHADLWREEYNRMVEPHRPNGNGFSQQAWLRRQEQPASRAIVPILVPSSRPLPDATGNGGA